MSRCWLAARFTASAFSQARAALPRAVYRAVLREMVKGLIPATEKVGLWRGHRTFLEDGSAFSMPDTPELQAHFGQPGGQAKGCGFPIAHILALVPRRHRSSLLGGHRGARCRSHDMAGVLGNPSFCSWPATSWWLTAAWLLVCLIWALADGQGRLMRCFACIRSRLSTSRRVAPMPGPPPKGRCPRGMPARSRWVSACGLMDQVVEYFKPVQRPKWMSEDVEI